MTLDKDVIFDRLTELVSMVKPDKQGRLRLPTERALAEYFQAPRFEVRGYMSTLEHLGFLKRIQGSGTYLQMPEPRFVQLYFEMALRLGYVSELYLDNAREMLDCAIVQLAAQNAVDDDIEELWARFRPMMESKDIDVGLDADYAFHEKLAMMTRNPVIVLIYQCLASVLKQVLYRRRLIVFHSAQATLAMNKTHIAIIEALKKRDPEQARQAMIRHFTVWNEQYFLVTSPK
jgi:DNA-binding FadR family transcriptional regulator